MTGGYPADVTSARHFDTWWKKARAADPGLLTMSPADLVGPAADEVSPADYPGSWAGSRCPTSSLPATRTTG